MRIGLVIPILLLVLGGGVVAVKARRAKTPPQTRVLSQETIPFPSAIEDTILPPQKRTMGAVEVEIIPESILVGSPMVFSLSLNTHSVELDYNFTQIVSVKDEKGNLYQVTDWDGEKGGHHLQGKLTFDELSEKTEQIELTAAGIDNQTATFKWNLKHQIDEGG